MKNLKKQLIRLGHQNPELRDHLRPILKVLEGKVKTSVSDRDHDEAPVDEWLEDRFKIDGLIRLFPQFWRHTDIDDYSASSGRSGWDVEANFIFELGKHSSLDEIIEKLNSREGRQVVEFRDQLYPLTRETFSGAGVYGVGVGEEATLNYSRDGESMYVDFDVSDSGGMY